MLVPRIKVLARNSNQEVACHNAQNASSHSNMSGQRDRNDGRQSKQADSCCNVQNAGEESHQEVTGLMDHINRSNLHHDVACQRDQNVGQEAHHAVVIEQTEQSRWPQTQQDVVRYNAQPPGFRLHNDRDDRHGDYRRSSMVSPFIEYLHDDHPRIAAERRNDNLRIPDIILENDFLSGEFIAIHYQILQDNNPYMGYGMPPNFVRLDGHPRLDATNLIPHPNQQMLQQDRRNFVLQQRGTEEWREGHVLSPRNGGFSERAQMRPVISVRNSRGYMWREGHVLSPRNGGFSERAQMRPVISVRNSRGYMWREGHVLSPRNGGFSERAQMRPVISVRNSREYMTHIGSPVLRLPQNGIDHERMCLVCRNRRAVAQLQPCGHVVYCDVCVSSQPSCHECGELVEYFNL
ncbi:uncharacterized protein LOC117327182 isoform X2 [Pecten maximus]|uniref:uncharacterized protein LOC117327182 isoform X2 n=1 Tax=Pecten maximus TaxID=6579 RepID=UPI001457EE4D|nr:uncharacterized protein LOC117327182 isoform X2 [Pecten maximus]